MSLTLIDLSAEAALDGSCGVELSDIEQVFAHTLAFGADGDTKHLHVLSKALTGVARYILRIPDPRTEKFVGILINELRVASEQDTETQSLILNCLLQLVRCRICSDEHSCSSCKHNARVLIRHQYELLPLICDFLIIALNLAVVSRAANERHLFTVASACRLLLYLIKAVGDHVRDMLEQKFTVNLYRSELDFNAFLSYVTYECARMFVSWPSTHASEALVSSASLLQHQANRTCRRFFIILVQCMLRMHIPERPVNTGFFMKHCELNQVRQVPPLTPQIIYAAFSRLQSTNEFTVLFCQIISTLLRWVHMRPQPLATIKTMEQDDPQLLLLLEEITMWLVHARIQRPVMSIDKGLIINVLRSFIQQHAVDSEYIRMLLDVSSQLLNYTVGKIGTETYMSSMKHGRSIHGDEAATHFLEEAFSLFAKYQLFAKKGTTAMRILNLSRECLLATAPVCHMSAVKSYALQILRITFENPLWWSDVITTIKLYQDNIRRRDTTLSLSHDTAILCDFLCNILDTIEATISTYSGRRTNRQRHSGHRSKPQSAGANKYHSYFHQRESTSTLSSPELDTFMAQDLFSYLLHIQQHTTYPRFKIINAYGTPGVMRFSTCKLDNKLQDHFQALQRVALRASAPFVGDIQTLSSPIHDILCSPTTPDRAKLSPIVGHSVVQPGSSLAMFSLRTTTRNS